MKFVASVLFLFATACGSAPPPATPATPATTTATQQYESAFEAASALMELMRMEAVFAQSVELMLDAQLQQNPQLARLKPTMMEFMNKHMSWNTLADEITQLYVDAYEHSELEELIAFYKTPLGTKSIALIPELMKQGAAIGVRRVQEHMPQLQQMLMEAMLRLDAETKAKTDESK